MHNPMGILCVVLPRASQPTLVAFFPSTLKSQIFHLCGTLSPRPCQGSRLASRSPPSGIQTTRYHFFPSLCLESRVRKEVCRKTSMITNFLLESGNPCGCKVPTKQDHSIIVIHWMKREAQANHSSTKTVSCTANPMQYQQSIELIQNSQSGTLTTKKSKKRWQKSIVELTV